MLLCKVGVPYKHAAIDHSAWHKASRLPSTALLLRPLHSVALHTVDAIAASMRQDRPQVFFRVLQSVAFAVSYALQLHRLASWYPIA